MPATRETILKRYHRDPTRLMDILIDLQQLRGCVTEEDTQELAAALGLSRADVLQTLSFYHFFSEKPVGRYAIYLNDSVVATLMGRARIAAAFESEVGVKFGEVTADGLIGLHRTACIGMNDQEPAALINGVVFTKLTPHRVKEIVRDIRAGKPVEDMVVEGYGDGQNHSRLVHAMVYNNIRKRGPVLEEAGAVGAAIRKIAELKPEDVIREVKESNIRGRGGAGFPTGMKWEFCRRAPGEPRYVFCNADEGEPGTFKDRVILTEHPDLVFEGMAVAGYAIGSTQGILYLRYEYKYLQRHLEECLDRLRRKNLLGASIAGKAGFDFDIRIQFGAGAYVCGEESALIESAEGKRGEPRDRPPFPVEKGYLGRPTIVNNVETLCSVVKILLRGGAWWRSLGTADSSGTKLLSISGDCMHPGVYEVEWGFSVTDILDMVGAYDVQAVQVGGPSGSLIGPDEFDRTLCFADLATGGSLIIFGRARDLLRDVVLNFLDFFAEESCGSCVPCRAITPMLAQKLRKILDGHGVPGDLEDLEEWTRTMKANRCGLGQTAPNPVLTSLKNFRHLYTQRLRPKTFDSGFDLAKATQEACRVTGRPLYAEEIPHA